MAGVSLLFLWLIWDLLKPVFWAVVLAILFAPVHQRLRLRLGDRDRLAAALSVTIILVLVILPLTAVSVVVGRELAGLYDQILSGEVDVLAPLAAVERAMPEVGRYLDRFGIGMDRVRQGLSESAVSLSRMLASQALSIGRDALRLVLWISVTLYLLFFFLRDGDRILDAIVDALPLGDVRERRLIARFASVARATIKGTVVVGLIQGVLAGATFAVLGIPGAAFWGLIMTILSLLPAVGAGIVWAPAAGVLLLTGKVAAGITLLAVGLLLIGLIDNVLRPLLVGRETRMPDWLILIAILGGLGAAGVTGFVLGPIVAGLFITVWDMFVKEHGPADDPEPPGDPPQPELSLARPTVEPEGS